MVTVNLSRQVLICGGSGLRAPNSPSHWTMNCPLTLGQNHLGDCQNYGPFLGPYDNTGPNLGDSKRDHNFDNPPNGFLHGE